MAAFRRLQPLRHLRGFQQVPTLDGRSQIYYSLQRENELCCRRFGTWSSTFASMRFGNGLGYSPVSDFSNSISAVRSLSTAVKAPPQMRQMGTVKVSMVSPGIVYEPYEPRVPISFWKRWFTSDGWKRTKQDLIMELKNAYAVAKLRKITGYSKHKFYEEAVKLYKEINIMIANGDKASLRKAVTDKMYSTLKNDIKQRESVWKSVHWELIEPLVKIRTLRARMIGIDRDDLNKAFIQLTLEFVAKQKFEAYDFKGAVVSGDKSKEVLVRDIWVFERSLFHDGSFWRLCGRIPIK